MTLINTILGVGGAGRTPRQDRVENGQPDATEDIIRLAVTTCVEKTVHGGGGEGRVCLVFMFLLESWC